MTNDFAVPKRSVHRCLVKNTSLLLVSAINKLSYLICHKICSFMMWNRVSNCYVQGTGLAKGGPVFLIFPAVQDFPFQKLKQFTVQQELCLVFCDQLSIDNDTLPAYMQLEVMTFSVRHCCIQQASFKKKNLQSSTSHLIMLNIPQYLHMQTNFCQHMGSVTSVNRLFLQ